MPETTGGAVRRLLPLGTGSILMGAGRSAAGYLLEAGGGRILVDAGPGTLLRLSEAGVDAASIDSVLLSHFHPDHHADLIGLLFLRQNPELRDRLGPLHIVAPQGFRRILAAWSAVYGTWTAHPAEHVTEVGAGSFDVGPFHVDAYPAEHAVPAFCFRFTLEDGTVLAYSGDSGPCDGLVAACRGADLSWVECSFPDGAGLPGHMTPAAVRDLLAEAEPRVAGLTHFYPPMEGVLADAALWAELWAGLATRVVALRDLEELRF